MIEERASQRLEQTRESRPASFADPGRVRPWLRPWLIALTSCVLAIALWSWLRSPEAVAAAAAASVNRDVPYLDGDAIRYSRAFAERNKLQFASVATGALSPVMHVTGTVTFDPDRVAVIGARIAGRVRNVFRVEGDEVQAGDALAELESADLGEAQAAVIAARAHASAALANERRERELADAQISSRREAELAAANAASARADLVAAESRVRAMGGSSRDEPGILVLRSPLAGKIVLRSLSRGQFVEPTFTAFKVADLSRVFVELAVFERDIGAIRQGDRVEISSPGAGKESIEGRVAHVGDEIDAASKTASVRVIVEQPTSPLRSGQSVLAKIHTSAKAEPTIVLRRDAVTSVDGKATVFVAHDALSVEPRSVELGRQDGHSVEVLHGLSAGERVVVSGVFALKSELFR